MGKGAKHKRSDLVTVLREALADTIRETGVSARGIAAATGLDVAQLSRFARGERTLTLPAAAALAEYLGCELVRRKPRRTH